MESWFSFHAASSKLRYGEHINPPFVFSDFDALRRSSDMIFQTHRCLTQPSGKLVFVEVTLSLRDQCA